jgi:uncharacterized protein with HEPN domain
MADAKVPLALYHVLDAIDDFQTIVGTVTASELSLDRTRRYAAERCVEIISEASRRIPSPWKEEHPSIPWAKIAGIGSVIRHNYENVSPVIIVELRGTPLAELRTAIIALLDKYDPEGRPFRSR